MKKIAIISFILLFNCSINIEAQQLPIYSQYLLNDYAYNPAVAGKNDYFDVKSNHRYQWVGITDAPRTYTLTINGPLKHEKMGLGGFIYTDHVGPTRRTGFQASYSYHFRLNSTLKLSLALSAGLSEWKLDAHKITLDVSNDMVLINNIMRTVVPDAKFGFLLYDKNWFFGAAIPNLIQSKLEFSNTTNTGLSKLENHYYAHGGYTLIINEDINIEPSLLIKYGPPAPIQFDIMARAIWKQQVWAGLAYRTMDAASLMLGYLFKENILFGYSYDFSTSNIRNYSSGTHEFMLGVRFVRASTFTPPSSKETPE